MTSEAPLRDTNELLIEEVSFLKRTLGLEADAAFSAACRKHFNFSPSQARILRCLMAGRVHKETLFAAYDPPLRGEDADIRVIDVQIGRMRRALRRHGITIENVWNVGYRLAPEMIVKLQLILGERP